MQNEYIRTSLAIMASRKLGESLSQPVVQTDPADYEDPHIKVPTLPGRNALYEDHNSYTLAAFALLTLPW